MVARTELRVWDLASGQELLSMPIPVRVPPCAVSLGWMPFNGRRLRLAAGLPASCRPMSSTGCPDDPELAGGVSRPDQAQA
jgi:hypothetical protein